MARNLGDMVVAIKGDSTSFDTTVDKSGQKFEGLAKEIAKSSLSIAQSFKQIDGEAAVWGQSVDLIEQKQKALKNEISRLIASGIDPLDSSIEKLQNKYFELGAESDALKAKQDAYFKSIEKQPSLLDKIKENWIGVSAAIGGAIIAFNRIKAELDKVEAAWQAQAEAVAILGNVIKTTGAEAWTTQDALEGLAEQLSRTTKYADENILAMQGVLLGFRNITGKEFDQATKAVLDMATVMKMDLTSAAQAVGKALDNPAQGLDSLSRQGFKFTEQEKEMMKAMTEAGNIAGAQKIILDELAKTYGGAAEKAGELDIALKTKLKNAVGELSEEMGRASARDLAPYRQWLIDIATAATDAKKRHNELQQAIIDVGKGTATTDQRIAAETEQLNALKKTLDETVGAREEELQGLKDAIAAKENYINKLKTQALTEAKITASTSKDTADAAKLTLAADKKATEAAEKQNKINTARAKILFDYKDTLADIARQESIGLITTEEAGKLKNEALKAEIDSLSDLVKEYQLLDPEGATIKLRNAEEVRLVALLKGNKAIEDWNWRLFKQGEAKIEQINTITGLEVAEQAAIDAGLKAVVQNNEAAQQEIIDTVIGAANERAKSIEHIKNLAIVAEEGITQGLATEVQNRDSLLDEQVKSVIEYAETLRGQASLTANTEIAEQARIDQAVKASVVSNEAAMQEIIDISVDAARERVKQEQYVADLALVAEAGITQGLAQEVVSRDALLEESVQNSIGLSETLQDQATLTANAEIAEQARIEQAVQVSTTNQQGYMDEVVAVAVDGAYEKAKAEKDAAENSGKNWRDFRASEASDDEAANKLFKKYRAEQVDAYANAITSVVQGIQKAGEAINTLTDGVDDSVGETIGAIGDLVGTVSPAIGAALNAIGELWDVFFLNEEEYKKKVLQAEADILDQKYANAQATYDNEIARLDDKKQEEFEALGWIDEQGRDLIQKQYDDAIKLIKDKLQVELEALGYIDEVGTDLIEKRYKAEIDAIDANEVAALAALGIIEETESDKIQKRIDAINLELTEEISAREKAILEEELAELTSAKTIADVKAGYEKERKDAKDKADKEKADRDALELQAAKDAAAAQKIYDDEKKLREDALYKMQTDYFKAQETMQNAEKAYRVEKAMADKKTALAESAIARAKAIAEAKGNTSKIAEVNRLYDTLDKSINDQASIYLTDEQKAEIDAAIARKKAHDDALAKQAADLTAAKQKQSGEMITNRQKYRDDPETMQYYAGLIAEKYKPIFDEINKRIIPELALGGIAMPKIGGQTVNVAEAGVPEVILPLDRLDEVLESIGDRQQAGGNMTHLTVTLDSKPILDKIFPATRDGKVLISARSVV